MTKINANVLLLRTLSKKLEEIREDIKNSIDVTDKIKYYNKLYSLLSDRLTYTDKEIQEFLDSNVIAEDAAQPVILPGLDIVESVQETVQEEPNMEAPQCIDIMKPSTEIAKKMDEFMIYNYGSTTVEATSGRPQEKPVVDNNDTPEILENTLVISGDDKKVILPYKLEEINKIMEKHPKRYKSIQDVIDDLYTKPAKYYKNTAKARFREAFKLVTERENGSLRKALDLGVELFFNHNIHPAVISACKNMNELDVYLSCLEYNELDDFHFFKIIFNSVPAIVKLNKMGRRMQEM